MREDVPLADVFRVVLAFVADRDDAVLFGAQAVNAYCEPPRMTGDIDLMSTRARLLAEDIRTLLAERFGIAVRVRDVAAREGFRIYQLRKPKELGGASQGAAPTARRRAVGCQNAGPGVDRRQYSSSGSGSTRSAARVRQRSSVVSEAPSERSRAVTSPSSARRSGKTRSSRCRTALVKWPPTLCTDKLQSIRDDGVCMDCAMAHSGLRCGSPSAT